MGTNFAYLQVLIDPLISSYWLSEFDMADRLLKQSTTVRFSFLAAGTEIMLETLSHESRVDSMS